MHIDGQMFLITASEPMQLTLQTPIKSESANALGMALQNQLQVLRERGFPPIKLSVDSASGFMSLRTQFPGLLIEPGGAKDHVVKVDAKIRRLKETYRSVKAGLPDLGKRFSDLCSISFEFERYECDARSAVTKSTVHRFEAELGRGGSCPRARP